MKLQKGLSQILIAVFHSVFSVSIFLWATSSPSGTDPVSTLPDWVHYFPWVEQGQIPTMFGQNKLVVF